MKGRKPFATRMKIAFATAAAALGLGITAGGLDTLPKNPDTDTQRVTTFNQGRSDVYGYNISPLDQLWKATLSMKTADGLAADALKAADEGDSWRMKALLLGGMDAHSPGAEAALEMAALRGHADVVNVLLAGTNPAANDGAALVAALRGGHKNIAYNLLAKGVSGGAKDSAGLSIAALNGDAEMIDALMNAGADAKANSSQALRYAAFMGHSSIISTLLSAGAEVGAQDHDALRQAAEAGKLDVLQLLVLAGGDVGANNGAALVAAAAYGHSDIVKFMLDQKKTYTGIDVMVGGDPYSYKVPAVNPNAGDGSALVMAVEGGHVETARILMNAGASPNAGNGAALATAVFNGNYTMAEMLLVNGADPNAGNGAALHMAVTMDNAMMTQFLVLNNAVPDAKIKAQAELSKNAELKEVLSGKVLPHLDPWYGF